MISVRLITPAYGEIAEAAETYLAESKDVTRRFYDELDRVVDLITANPRIGRPAEFDSRRVTLRRFPYDVVYRLTVDEAVIYAVAHHRRNPDYWTDRL